MLAEWEELLASGAFVKVMPHDYKRVLRELAEQEAVAAHAVENGGAAIAVPSDALGAPQPEEPA